MNLGNLQRGSFAVAIAVFGLVGVRPTEGRADAVPALEWPADAFVVPVAEPARVVDLPVPPRLVMTPETAQPTSPTTSPPPVETTTTSTTLPPLPASPPTTGPTRTAKPPAVPRPSAATGGPGQAQVEAVADSTGWNWRAAGVRFRMGFHPTQCCHWGVYEAATSIIWVGPTAFGDGNRLRYVVLHELAHAWQYRQNRFRQFIDDYARWGFTTIGPALEAGADCVASVWGAARGHYWSCPSDARALAIRRLHGDWR